MYKFYNHTPFFYGWVILAIATISSSIMSGLGVWAMSIFILPMESELGWGRTTIFLAFTIRALLLGTMAPILGPWLDRKNGPRVALFVAGLATGGSLLLTGMVQNALQYQLAFGVLGAVGMLGTGMTMTHVVLPRWFVRLRGRAIACAMAGAGSGPLLYPLLVGNLVEAVGWREAWMILGLIATLVLVPASLLVYRSPEDVGLTPDGDKPICENKGKSGDSIIASEPNYTVKEMFKTNSFWLIMIAFCTASLAPGGFQVQWVPHFQSQGFSLELATSAIMVYAIVSIPGRFIWGFLAERIPLRYVYSSQSLITAFACLAFLFVPGALALFLAAMLMGVGMGGYFILQPLILPDYFGRRHLGAIVGASRPFTTIATAAGPILVAFLYDTFGSYTWSFITIAIAWGISALASYFAVPPGPTGGPGKRKGGGLFPSDQSTS